MSFASLNLDQIKVKMEFTHEDDEAHLTDDEGDGNDEYLEISDTVSTVVSLCISTRSVHRTTRTRLFFIITPEVFF